MALGWHVLRIEPRAEYVAVGELERDGYDIYFPRVNSPNQRKGHADEPLFPGYLFIRCDAVNEGWPSFRPAHRVTGWVNFGGSVPTVPDEVLTELADRVAAINADKGLWHRFRRGERVHVVSEVLEGLGQVIEEAKSPQGKAKVLMELMGRSIPVHLPWQNLRPLGEQQAQKPRIPRRTRGNGRWIQGNRPRGLAGA